MSKKNRNYFTAVPEGASYSRFKKGNLTSEATFGHLLDSCLFFDENGDTATTTDNGHARLETDAQAKLRTNTPDSIARMVQAHQLPLMVVGDNTIASTIAGGAVSYDGIKLTPIENTGSDGMNFKIEYEPDNLTIAVADSTADYITFIDTTDSNRPKKQLISTFFANTTTYWDRTVTTLEPSNANDSLDMGTGELKGGDVELDGTVDRTIRVIAGSGIRNRLSIHGSASTTDAGGNLYLHGGNSTGVAGGKTYLYGGNGSVKGDVYIAYNGSAQAGNVGVGGVPAALYRMKVYDSMLVETNLDIGGNVDITGNVCATGIEGTSLLLSGSADLGTISAGGANTDEWVQNNSGTLETRSNTQLLSDISGCNNSLSNLSSVAINTALLPAVKGLAIGNITYPFGNLFIDNGSVINWYNGDLTLTHSSNLLTLAGGNLIVNGDFATTGIIEIGSIAHSATDLSSWLQEDGGTIVYRTTAELKSDLGLGTNLWDVVSTDNYTQAPPSTSKLTMSNTTGMVAGLPIKYYTGGIYCYGIIRTVSTNTSIDISGPAMGGNVTELYVGSASLVHTEHFRFDGVWGNAIRTAAATAGALYQDLNMKHHFIWGKSEAAIVEMISTCLTPDSTTDPTIDLEVSDDNITYSDVFILPIDVDNSIHRTVVTADPTYYTMNYGDYLDISVVAAGGTGDSANADIWVTFVLK